MTMVPAILIKHSLKTRITLTTLLIFLAGIWSLSFYAHRILREDMQRLLGEQQLSTVSMVAAQVERELQTRIESLEAVARLSTASMQAGPAAMQHFLEHRLDLQGLFSDGIFVTSIDGTAIAAAPIAAERVGINFGGRDYLLRALRDGRSTIGRPLLSKVAQVPVTSMAVPIRDEHGQIIGALAGVTHLGMPNFLDQLIAGRYGKTGGYLIIAPQHRLIVTASNKQRVLEPLDPAGGNPFDERSVQGDAGSGLTVDPLGDEVLYSFKRIPLAEWDALVYLPTNEAFFPIRDLQQRLRLAALLLTLLAGALTWWLLKRQLSPLLATANTLVTVADSDQAHQPLPIVRRDEIGLLISAFNHLLATLANRETALRESEEHFRQIFENSGDAIFFASPNDQIETANPAACRLFGYSQDEFRGLGPAGIMDFGDPRLIPAIRKRNRTGRFCGELRAIRRDGRLLEVDVNSTCFCDAKGGIHTISQLRDVSERKRIEDAVRLSEARLKRAELAANMGNWELHLDSGKMIGSAGAIQLFGLGLAEADAVTIKNLLLPEYIPLHDAAFKRLLESGEPYDIEFKIKTADRGEVKDIRTIAQFDKGRGVIFGIVQDIGERKRTEARLQLAADVFSHVREGIMIADADGIIVEVNDAFTRITGFERSDAIGQSPRILKSGRQTPEFYAQLWQSLADQHYWSGEIWNQRKNGELYAQGLTISAVRDSLGRTQNYVGLFTDITRTKELQEQLQRIAHYDALTNLPNRVLLADRLQQALAQCRRKNSSVAVVYLDLDDFKTVNDSHGHGVGDDLLVAVAQRMKEALREGDTLSRIGGDEFVAVLVNLEQTQSHQPAIARLLQAAAAPVVVDGLPLQVSVSIGVTLYPQDPGDPDLLLRHADQALYVAKQLGKNRYHLFDVAHDAAVSTQREGLQHIRTAFDQGEFVLHYQPKVNMRSGEVVGAEALIRWQHPQRGLLNPIAFLPSIENDTLTVELGEWVIGSALSQIELWHGQGLNIPVSVNIAARHLQQSDFADRLQRILAAHASIRPGDLAMEVLESSALDDLNRVSQNIKDCQSLGVSFALDDFGTGYSSLTYLKRLPVSLLKIDQSFVRDMLDDPDDLAILEGVIGLSTAFRRDVIAEGVETIEQGELLLELGCEQAQGYGIGRPMPAADFPRWAAAWRPDARWLGKEAARRDDLPLLFAQVEHRAWLLGMEKYLSGEAGELPPLAENQCRLGRWLATKGRVAYAGYAEFQAAERVHRKVHALVTELDELKAKGRSCEALARIDELHVLKDALIAHLKALQGQGSAP
jgi:diguanylate cyclase (GGDEF)-like protein/PAS domain S-box-containing protein